MASPRPMPDFWWKIRFEHFGLFHIGNALARVGNFNPDNFQDGIKRHINDNDPLFIHGGYRIVDQVDKRLFHVLVIQFQRRQILVESGMNGDIFQTLPEKGDGLQNDAFDSGPGETHIRKFGKGGKLIDQIPDQIHMFDNGVGAAVEHLVIDVFAVSALEALGRELDGSQRVFTSWAMRRATSRQAAIRWAFSSSVTSSNTRTPPIFFPVSSFRVL